MKLKSIIRNMVFVLCVLFSFQARAYLEVIEGNPELDLIREGRHEPTPEAAEPPAPDVITDLSVYIDGHEEKTKSVRSNSFTELTISKGQYINIHSSCRFDATDTVSYDSATDTSSTQDNNHWDDFTYLWGASSSSVSPITYQGESSEIVTAYAFLSLPTDGGDAFYTSVGLGGSFSIFLTCYYDQSSALSHEFKFNLKEYTLVAEATHDNTDQIDMREGESTMASVKFWGDVNGCNEPTNARRGVLATCVDTLSYSVDATNGNNAGVTVDIDDIRFFNISTEQPAKYYVANVNLSAVASGEYRVNFVVQGAHYSIQQATDSLLINVNPAVAEVPITPTDADTDGYDSTVDCNDSDAAIYPQATEVCDLIDNNCNALVDEGLGTSTYYFDSDRDGHGTINRSRTTCMPQPQGYVASSDDCNDRSNTVYPGATEYCDGIDNDCDSVVDGASCAVPVDADNDGYLSIVDCNDGDPQIYPGREEICSDNIDNNCDGTIDGGTCDAVAAPVDADGDGYLSTIDCDDTNASINTGASDDCTNQIDMNCDGVVTNCSVSPPPTGVEPLLIESAGSTTGGGGCSLGGVGVPANAGFLFFLFGVGLFRYLMKRS